jgi:hypothetical protein
MLRQRGLSPEWQPMRFREDIISIVAGEDR